MADEEDLKEKVKTVLKEKDSDAALELLTGDNAYEIAKGERNRLALLAMKDAYVAGDYQKIIGLLSDEPVKKMNEELGKFGEPNVILEVLEDPEYRKQRDAIVSAAISNNKGLRIAELYRFSIASVSDEVKERLNTALGRNVWVKNEELIDILGDSGFATYRSVILRHLEARMDADELEEFLNEAQSVLPDAEVQRLQQTAERKKKYAHE
jgi:hypothetical protein